MIITIDGPSGAGKGTVAKYLAEKFNLKMLDTGLLYRAVAAQMLNQGLTENDLEAALTIARSMTIEKTNQPGLRTETVAAMASKVAALPAVREILNDIQRKFASDPHPGYEGVVLDGRDIGTVICPEAPCKVFLTASPEVRVERRRLQEQSQEAKQIEKLMSERDTRDSSRQVAPLNIPKDAYLIDTSHLTIDEVCEKAAYYVENYCFKLPGCRRQIA